MEPGTSERASPSIVVAVRPRPSNGELVDLFASDPETMCFDHVFTPTSKNGRVYDMVARDVVEAAMRGFNSTILAYGATGSGKTHTMIGNDLERGIVAEALHQLFTKSEKVVLRLSMVEVYNETVYDLLAPTRKVLQITDEHIIGLREEAISSAKDAIRLFGSAISKRETSHTRCNQKSSRSHVVCRVSIEGRRFSFLNMIDLAGSESAKAALSPEHIAEGRSINQSLLAVKMVVQNLGQGSKFINYRDSKITRLLEPSLNYNARIAIICTLTPTSASREDM